MRLSELFRRDDAVAPVIGTILMVAVTVILAALIATFVIGMGEEVKDQAPQATFSFEFDETATQQDDFGTSSGPYDGLLTVTHLDGAVMDAENLALIGASSQSVRGSFVDAGYDEGSQIDAGSQVSIYADQDDTVRVTWSGESGEQSATLAQWTGPEA